MISSKPSVQVSTPKDLEQSAHPSSLEVRRSRRPVETQNVNPTGDADCAERAITPQRACNAGNATLRMLTRSAPRWQYHPLAGCEPAQDLSLGHARFVWCDHSSSPTFS